MLSAQDLVYQDFFLLSHEPNHTLIENKMQ